ncbi:MAG: hypothetical protein ACREJ5_16580 [Geminicoccaceae bacterium]
MVLSKAIVHDPPAARRFRLVALVLVILGLALLVMLPGILIHMSNVPPEGLVWGLLHQLVLEEGG